MKPRTSILVLIILIILIVYWLTNKNSDSIQPINDVKEPVTLELKNQKNDLPPVPIENAPEIIKSIIKQPTQSESKNSQTNEEDQPKWSKSLHEISNNKNLSRTDKITQIAKLLKEFPNDHDALSNIIIALGSLNPSEAITDILPFLNNKSEYVANAAIYALATATELNEKEQQQQFPDEKLAKLREQIATSINKLLQDNPSSYIKDSILSTYNNTNNNEHDRQKMLDTVLADQNLNFGTLSYITDVLTDPSIDNYQLFDKITSKPVEYKSAITLGLVSELAYREQPFASYDSKQLESIAKFINNNPLTKENFTTLLDSKSNENIEYLMDFYESMLENLKPTLANF